MRKLGGNKFLTAVCMVTVTAVDVEPVGTTGLGVISQLAPGGNPLQTRLIGCVNPLTGVTCNVTVADCPAETVAVGVVVVTEKSGTVEVLPERLATRLCGGCPATSSTMERNALRFPGAEGVKSTVMAHWLLAANIAPQVLVTIAKSPEFAPVREILVMVTGDTPLTSVTVCVWLVVPWVCGAKVSPVGLIAMPSRTPIFEANASQFPPGVAWAGLESGKSREQVCPAT